MRLVGLFALWTLSIAMSAQAQHIEPEGRADYVRYCAACHGEDADGKGPVANVLTPPPPDLRHLRPKYGEHLGTDLVVYIMGTTMPRAHGTLDMPVWGRNLRDANGDDSKGVLAIWRIVHYLEWIQKKN